jgi:hypothetical protein
MLLAPEDRPRLSSCYERVLRLVDLQVYRAFLQLVPATAQQIPYLLAGN